MPFQKRCFEMKENSFLLPAPLLSIVSSICNLKPRILNWRTTENTLLNTMSSWEILGPGILVNF